MTEMSALTQDGRMKTITAHDAAVGSSLGEELAQQIGSAVVDDKYGAALAVWLDLTARLVKSGVPLQILQNQALCVAMRVTSAGNA